MKLFTLIILFVLCSQTLAVDIKLLQNNKEGQSYLIGRQQQRSIKNWLLNQNNQDLKLRIHQFLKETLASYSDKSQCELYFIRTMKEKAANFELTYNDHQMIPLLLYLRTQNYIDDLFLKITMRLITVDIYLSNLEYQRPTRPFNTLTEMTREINIQKLYSNFKKMPDEESLCTISSWRTLIYELGWNNLKNRDALLKKLNYLAYSKKEIEINTLQTLDLLTELDVIDWEITLYQYFDILKNAKDKLVKQNGPEGSFSSFSSPIISRKEKITHRERLYRQFNSTQVMMLAEIISKTSKRMDAKRISINIEYPEMPSVPEIYVLSPMEKYRLSLKMLRKDMAETMRSDIFQGKTIEYEDLVSAAFETGLIQAKDLEMILKFEEFWNPQVPRWKMYTNFAFQMAGSASFYLPAPFNILGALALAITQTKVINQDKTPDSDDNWNVVI
jgi:hypothetical protein